MDEPGARTIESAAPSVRRTDPRDAALRVLTRHAEQMPDLHPLQPETRGMDPRDAALAHTLVDASLRRWLTLSYVVHAAGQRDPESLEPKMRAALICGAAQLMLLDRVPDHAAISETVGWAKRNIREKAGGMVNAILRRVAEARAERLRYWDDRSDAIPLSTGGALRMHRIRLPDDPHELLGIACSLPAGLVESWSRLDADPGVLAMHTLVHPPTVCRCDDRSILQSDDRFTRHHSPSHAVYVGGREALADTLREYPSIAVQDAGASHVVEGLDDEGEETVVDLCAGRGTKTRQLLGKFPDARIIACEIDEDRLGSLRSVFAGEPRVEVVHADQLAERGPGWADLVLTDVPCSNSGVLPRRTEARYRVRSRAMERLISTQRDIMRTAAGLVGHGGRVIYSTCSLELEENQLQAQWGQRTLGLSLERERPVLPEGLPGGNPVGYRDGSYAAEMRVLDARTGDEASG
ncbi:MAG: transcription antitermination factor NusB [Planctomycetota bacterium]